MDRIAADGITLAFNPDGGVIDDLVIEPAGGTPLRPLHKAPWVRDGEALPDHVAPVERRLAGDFFCAPFGGGSAEVPIHGWAANGTWESQGANTAAGGTVTATYRLRCHNRFCLRGRRRTTDCPLLCRSTRFLFVRRNGNTGLLCLQI